jgi:hypothetical protein
MDINHSISPRHHRPSPQYSVPQGSSGAVDSTEQSSRRSRTTMPFGDSLLVPLARKADPKPARRAETVLKRQQLGLKVARGITAAIGGASGFMLAILASLPIIVPLLTFGTCFVGGIKEWAEFSRAALRWAVIPGIVSGASFLLCYGAHRALSIINQRIDVHNAKVGLSPLEALAASRRS